MKPRIYPFLVAFLGFVVLVLANTSRAESISSSLNASLTSGSLSDVNFPVSFSYDNSTLTGHGEEYISLLSFDFTLLGVHFTAADIRQGGQAIFQDGTLESVTAAFFPPPPNSAPVRDIAFGFGGPGVIGYQDLSGEFGEGSYSFASTPEPATLVNLIVAVGALLLVGVCRAPCRL